MKVAAQEIEHSQVILDIEVEDERLERAVDQAYRRIVQRINVPGFRKGKAPRALVERMVGRDALVEDAVEHLVPEVVEAAVKDQDLTMVARPTLELVSREPLQLKATVPVQPKVELGDYKSLKVEAKAAEITDEQIDSVLTRLQESNATWEPVERAAESGDRVAIDVSGKVSETVIIDSKDAEYVIDPDGPQPAEGFADAIIGMTAEESKTVTLKLPEDYRNTEIAGSDAEFSFTLHWVKARSLPPLDDDFATTVGTEYASMDELRNAIRENLLSREEHERRIEHETEVIQTVVDQATIDLPPQMVEEETDRLYDQMAANFERQGIPLQSYLRLTQKSDEQFRSELETQAERNVRQIEVMNAIAEAEGIEVTDDEIREEIGASAESDSERNRLVRETMRRPAVKERVGAAMRRQRAVRILLETVGGIDFDALLTTSVAPDDDEDTTDVSEEATSEAEAVATDDVTTDEAETVATDEDPAVSDESATDESDPAERRPVAAAEQSSKPAAQTSGETPA